MTIADTRRHIEQSLAPLYDRREAAWIARILLEHYTGKSEVDLLIGANKDVSDFTASKIDAAIARLLANEPVQYVTGEAYFHGHTFEVTPATLIPRPETAELVDMIVDDAADRPDLRVLDLGTGSGCIALSLALALKFAQVKGIDISADAVAVARANARRLKARATFDVADILAITPEAASLDIVVSNPPYIAEHERSAMHSNVLDYEPSTALFVPDDNPLLFYRAITAYAATALASGGRLYFEINPLYAAKLVAVVEAMDFDNVVLTLDSQQRRRFLSATKR